jgi:hypothetical protein
VAVALLVCGDQACPHRLTCTDLLNLPIEDLMEIRILSRLEGPAYEHKPTRPSPSALRAASFEPPTAAVSVS